MNTQLLTARRANRTATEPRSSSNNNAAYSMGTELYMGSAASGKVSSTARTSGKSTTACSDPAAPSVGTPCCPGCLMRTTAAAQMTALHK